MSASPPEPSIPADRSLEIPAAKLRRWMELALSRVLAHLESLPDQPVTGPGLPAPSPLEPLPRQGTPLEPLLDHLFDEAVPHTYNTASPGYMAYIPGGGLPQTALADFVASAVNRYVGVYAAAPLLARLEANALHWLAEMLGMPASTRGLLTSGGSLANFTALHTARCERLPEDFLGGTLYASDQAHHSVAKAARLAGFPASSLRTIPSDPTFRMCLDALAEAVVRDRKDGRAPFLVVASAGTTNTGAVDDLEGIAALCRSEGLWLHVDAAYGGFFVLTAQGQRLLRGLGAADSVVVDPHKGLFLPYGTGALLVRDGAALRRAHATATDYMPALQRDDDPAVMDFCEHGPELSRGFRGLRVWLPLKLHGLAPFVANLEEKLALAAHAARRLRAMDGMEILAEPQLSVVAFRLRREGMSPEQTDALNRRLLERILARRRVFLSATTLRGAYALRICVLSFRTHQDRVDEALEIIAQEAAGLSGPA